MAGMVCFFSIFSFSISGWHGWMGSNEETDIVTPFCQSTDAWRNPTWNNVNSFWSFNKKFVLSELFQFPVNQKQSAVVTVTRFQSEDHCCRSSHCRLTSPSRRPKLAWKLLYLVDPLVKEVILLLRIVMLTTLDRNEPRILFTRTYWNSSDVILCNWRQKADLTAGSDFSVFS